MTREEVLEKSRAENRNQHVFVILAMTFTVKAVRLRRAHEILLAAACWVFVITFSFAHIFQLFTAATA